MRKAKKRTKRMKDILNVALAMALLVGSMSLSSLDVEAAESGSVVETAFCSEDNNTGIEVLDAEIIEDMEWNSGIMPYTMLTRCDISVSGDSQGMHIDISTGCVGTASVIGVKDVKVQKKNENGGWDTVATSSGGELYNRTSIGIRILYKNAEKGATYKITCVHYADVDGYTEGDNDSGSFKFNF